MNQTLRPNATPCILDTCQNSAPTQNATFFDFNFKLFYFLSELT